MDKAVVNMYGWILNVHNEQYYLSGIAENHPRLGRNSYVYQTSTLQKFSFEEDELTFETQNTIYKCPLKYMHTEPYINMIPEYVEELTKRDEVSSSILDKIIAASAKLTMGVDLDNEFMAHILEVTKNGKMEREAIKKADDDRMIKIAKEYDDCIYIEASNITGGDTLAYHFGNECGTVEPDIHIGTYQDSILYMKYRQSEEDVALDFRYFPRESGDCIETYSWSDNIKQAVIKNTRDFCIIFNDQEIAPGELKVFTPEGHKQGLISPDCYNGKSILFDIFQEEDKEKSV